MAPIGVTLHCHHRVRHQNPPVGSNRGSPAPLGVHPVPLLGTRVAVGALTSLRHPHNPSANSHLEPRH